MYSFIGGGAYESRIMTASSFLFSSQNHDFSSFFGAKTTVEDHTVYVGTTTITANIVSISDLLRLRVLDPV